MRMLSPVTVGIVAVCLYGLNGCGDGQPAAPADGGETAADAHEHDHPAEGPHGGHIIELGTEDYHAELKHFDDSHRVGVYFVGSDAKTTKAIAAQSVTINVSVDGQPSQYTLEAVPQEGEADGTSSYFELDSEPLHTVVAGESDAQKSHARLNVTIDGKPYVGLIETDPHDHDHDHAH